MEDGCELKVRGGPMPDDELLTIAEAAKRLNISRLDLRYLLQGKKLPAIKTERGE
jgi:excisionase family DNA binding protein